MRINSVKPMSFGKIHVTMADEQKDTLYEHAAHGIGDGSVANFKEKYRLANLSKNYDIEMNENGANVLDKNSNKKTGFDVQIYSEYPNALYHTLNAAINYVLIKESGTFEPEKPVNYRELVKQMRRK